MPGKILIADDDQDFVTTLKERLKSEGYEVVCAYDGVRTIEMAHKEAPGLILLDWQMPAGKGDTVIEALSRKEDTKGIPIIIITGVDEPGMREKAASFGVKAFISKPYNPKELLEKISEIST